MIVAFLTGFDQLGHHLPDHRAILVLVAAGAYRHIETGQIRLVVYRDPIIAHVIQIDNTPGMGGDRQVGDALRDTIYLRLPLLFGDLAIEVIGVFHPFLRIAGWVLASDQQRISDLGSAVAADIVIGHQHSCFLVVNAFRRRSEMHFMAQGPGVYLHAVSDPGHFIDDERVGPGHVNNHGCIKTRATFQSDATNAAIGLVDFTHFFAEQELCAPGFRCLLDILDREHRVVNVASNSDIEGARDTFASGIQEPFFIRAFGRPERLQIHKGQPFFQLSRSPVFAGNAKR